MATLLVIILFVPLIAAAAITLRPAKAARGWALAATGACFFATLTMLGRYYADPPALGSFAAAAIDIPWLPALGLSLSFGLDSVAMMLIALTGLLGPICVLASWTAIQDRQRLFYGWLMVLQTAMYGVFAARDIAVFYVCFEFTLLPMFILIREFGSSNRRRAATKFFIYTFTGSLVALAGVVFTAAKVAALPTGSGLTLNIGTLIAFAPSALSAAEQAFVLVALLAGFAVKVPLFPVHTWLPLAHTEAPTAGSVILAGVLLKLGTYAIYRIVLPIVPFASYEYAPVLGVLAVVGIIYAGLICWVQTDIKRLVAYSSVSHLGFCVLGLFALNATGLSGSVLYMINHGLSTGALFLLIGFMYERYHTRDLTKLGGLASKMPVWSTFMVFFAMASVGLPGLNGFISELLCMMSAFQADSSFQAAANNGAGLVGMTWGNLGPWFGFAAATGVIVAAIYLLTMVAKIVWGNLKEPAGHRDHPMLPKDLSSREILTLAPLAALCIVLGVYPKPLLRTIEPDINRHVQMVSNGFDTPRSGDPLIELTDPVASDDSVNADRPSADPAARPATEEPAR